MKNLLPCSFLWRVKLSIFCKAVCALLTAGLPSALCKKIGNQVIAMVVFIAHCCLRLPLPSLWLSCWVVVIIYIYSFFLIVEDQNEQSGLLQNVESQRKTQDIMRKFVRNMQDGMGTVGLHSCVQVYRILVVNAVTWGIILAGVFEFSAIFYLLQFLAWIRFCCCCCCYFMSLLRVAPRLLAFFAFFEIKRPYSLW